MWNHLDAFPSEADTTGAWMLFPTAIEFSRSHSCINPGLFCGSWCIRLCFVCKLPCSVLSKHWWFHFLVWVSESKIGHWKQWFWMGCISVLMSLIVCGLALLNESKLEHVISFSFCLIWHSLVGFAVSLTLVCMRCEKKFEFLSLLLTFWVRFVILLC